MATPSCRSPSPARTCISSTPPPASAPPRNECHERAGRGRGPADRGAPAAALPVRPRARARPGAAVAGGALPRGGRRLPARARDPVRVQRRHDRQPDTALGRLVDVPVRDRRSRLRHRAAQQLPVHRDLAGVRCRALDRAGLRADPRLPWQVVLPLSRAPAVDDAGSTVGGHLAVDARLDLQPVQLAARQTARAVSRRARRLARRRAPGDKFGDRAADLAHPAAGHRHRHGRPELDTAGHQGRHRGRRRPVLAPHVPDRPATARAGHSVRGAVRPGRDRAALRPPLGGGVMAAVIERRVSGRVGLWVLIVLFGLFCAFPFLFATITMFKQNTDVYTRPNGNQLIFTKAPTLSNLTLLFHHTQYGTFVVNNVVIGVCVVAITLALSLPAAYSLARAAGWWAEKVGIGVFVVYLVPPTLLFLPLSQLVTRFGLQDSIWSLVVVYPSFTVPLSTWLLMGFFKSIPREIEEQAQVDGYSRLGAVVRAVLPLALPGIFTVVVFTFTLTMQDFIYALSFVSSSSNMTVSVGVPTNLIRGDVFYWQALMASAIVVAVPVALLYNLFLDKFIQGFTMGAVKG